MSNIAPFIQKSGFKVLAMARLSQCEYSMVLYLMNCAVSGLDQIITTEAELAALIGYEEDEVIKALELLAERQMIRAHYSESQPQSSAPPSLRLGFQPEMQRWLLDYEKDATSHDAVVYPFIRSRSATLELLAEKQPASLVEQDDAEATKNQTWQRILTSFCQGRSLDQDELEQNEVSAKILVETHPVDQLLLLLRHFGLRIPSLSLLASNWDHYQELYEHETQKVDFLDARKKHQELDEELRHNTKCWLARAQEHQLTSGEINILKLLMRHRHPRRQLFWAYQARSRYTNLEHFFEENAHLMLAITTTGTIVRRPYTPPANHEHDSN